MRQTATQKYLIKQLSSELIFNSIDEMQDVSNSMGCVIIFVSGDISCPIQTIIPSEITNSVPLVIGIGQENFYVTIKLPKPSKKNKKDKCQCGKSPKVTLACTGEGCPCFEMGVPCWKNPPCTCKKCGNKFGGRLASRPKGKDICRCKNACNGLRCPCFRIGVSCLTNPRY